MRKVAAILLAVCVMASSSFIAFGEPIATEITNMEGLTADETVEVDGDIIYYHFTEIFRTARNILIKQIGIGLAINDGWAEIYTEGTTYENGTIKVTAKLQQYKNSTWRTIKTFTNTETNSRESYIEEKYAVERGYDYQVETTVTATVNGNTETITKTGLTRHCD